MANNWPFPNRLLAMAYNPFPQNNWKPIVLNGYKLLKWNESENTGVKYFSGKAGYKGRFEHVKEYLAKDVKLTLDLGQLRNLARVKIKDQVCADLWKEPFQADITRFVSEGENILEIEGTIHASVLKTL
jgi:hypothetical protein